MGFPEKVKTNVLLRCKRCCCLCGKYAGIYMELHHIIQSADGGDDTEDNCIPLCLNCHGEVKSFDPHHPKGNKYRVQELKKRRDEIYLLVQNSIINIYTPEDVEKVQKFMNKYFRAWEMLISIDPCGQGIDPALVDIASCMTKDLLSYEYKFDNIDLDREKCTFYEALSKWLNLLNTPSYFHEANGGEFLCFTNSMVNEYREEMGNLRVNMAVSYMKFRTAATMRAPFQTNN